MSKPEWGVKRSCPSCGTRFYDMKRSPILCPKCGATVETEITFRPRRGGSAQASDAKAAPVARIQEVAVVATEDIEDIEVIEDEEAAEPIEGAEEEEDALIEDASDLGEDDDDMAEVMEHLDEDLEGEI